MASVSKRRWTHKGVSKEAWVVRYVDRGGRHRSRQFAMKKPAETFRREVESELDAGTHVARRDSRTIADLCEEFEHDVGRRHADGQVGRGYIDRCRTCLAYVTPVLGNVLARDLTWQQVEALAIGLRTTITKKTGAPLTKRSIANILSTFGTAVGYGVRRGYAARNVVPDAQRELGPPRIPAIATFGREEIRALLVTMETRQPYVPHRTHAQLKAMVYLATVCGLRKGEIAALRWDHIDFEAGAIHVRQSIDDYDVVKGPKTKAGIRTVPLPRALAAVMEAYRPHAVLCSKGRGLIFRTATGSQLVNVGFYKMWHRLLAMAELPPRHFHALRHFAGSAWLEAGMSLPEVSRLLGHADTAITAKVYSHAIVETTFRAPEIEALARSIVPQLPAPIAQELRKAA